MDNIANRIIEMIIFLPLFLIAITFHEYAHGYAAFRAGDDTAKHSGRLTLNPIAHIDPIGLLFFFISAAAGFGFGWAKPVPVNPLRYKNMKRDEIIVSLAGVAANFGLMILTAIVMKILVVAGVMNLNLYAFAHPAGLQDYLQSLMLRFYFLNGILFVFNLIPVPPLDGSHVFIWLFSRDPMMTEAKYSRFGFLFIFLLLFSRILNVIIGFAVHVMSFFLSLFF